MTDGSIIRAVVDTSVGQVPQTLFTQLELFTLRTSGLLLPNQTVLANYEADHFLKIGAYPAINANDTWRCLEYAFYRKGFDSELELPFGDSIIHVEQRPDDGRALVAVLRIPKDIDVEFVSLEGKMIKTSLQNAYGLGVVNNFEKLQVNPVEDNSVRVVYEVTFASNFNPKTDLSIIDIMRPAGWGAADENMYPLRTSASLDMPNAEQRCSAFRDSFYSNATGFHGSILRGIFDNEFRSVIFAQDWMAPSGVAVIERALSAQPQPEAHVDTRPQTPPKPVVQAFTPAAAGSAPSGTGPVTLHKKKPSRKREQPDQHVAAAKKPADEAGKVPADNAPKNDASIQKTQVGVVRRPLPPPPVAKPKDKTPKRHFLTEVGIIASAVVGAAVVTFDKLTNANLIGNVAGLAQNTVFNIFYGVFAAGTALAMLSIAVGMRAQKKLDDYMRGKQPGDAKNG